MPPPLFRHYIRGFTIRSSILAIGIMIMLFPGDMTRRLWTAALATTSLIQCFLLKDPKIRNMHTIHNRPRLIYKFLVSAAPSVIAHRRIGFVLAAQLFMGNLLLLFCEELTADIKRFIRRCDQDYVLARMIMAIRGNIKVSLSGSVLIAAAPRPTTHCAHELIRSDSTPGCIFGFSRPKHVGGGFTVPLYRLGVANMPLVTFPQYSREVMRRRNCVYVLKGIGHRLNINILNNTIIRQHRNCGFRSIWFNSYHRNFNAWTARCMTARWKLTHRKVVIGSP